MDKEQRETLNNFRNNMFVGIISGLIVVATIRLYDLILESTSPPFSVPLAFIGSTILMIFLIWWLVERPIKIQKQVYASKKVEFSPLNN